MIGESLIDERTLQTMLAIASLQPEGDFCEVGVYQGGSALRLAKLAREQDRTLWLYDTFTGIPHCDPQFGDSHKAGDFNGVSMDQITELIPDAFVIKGIFPHSAHPRMKRIAFAHLDCDQYRSTKDSALYLGERMVWKGVMWFDDYAQEGCKRAVHEVFGDRVKTIGNQHAYVRF